MIKHAAHFESKAVQTQYIPVLRQIYFFQDRHRDQGIHCFNMEGRAFILLVIWAAVFATNRAAATEAGNRESRMVIPPSGKIHKYCFQIVMFVPADALTSFTFFSSL